MRLRNVKNAKNIVDNSKYVINNPEEYIGNYKTLFNNDNPINIEIDKVFNKEINTIYLNFSDPWPKKRHAKRRLTSEIFLRLYDKIFINTPHIIQKTDNIGLFASSLVSLSKYGYTLEEVSLDLKNESIDNVVTEYENKFMNLGTNINYLNAKKYK